MRICKRCNEEKGVSEFGVDRSKSDGVNIYCKECVRQNWMNYPRKKRRAKADKQRERLHSFIIDYLQAHPCQECGDTRLPVLQFHHLNPDDKEFTVSTLVSQRRSLKLVKREVEKCVVLCANCHLMHHAQENGTYRSRVEENKNIGWIERLKKMYAPVAQR